VLSVLLHHHQPDYRDPVSGLPVLPYVRTHATRGYRDVALALRESGAPVTVNLVPSMLDQWDHYAAGGTDPFLELARRPADTLEPDEVRLLLELNPAWTRWWPALGELRARAAAGRLSVAGVRDAQVWSNLAWFGWSALRDWPELGELRLRGVGFGEDDKARVLAIQRLILEELPGLYRGLPHVTASAYYHPILPLLVDTSHARRSLPDVPDVGFRHPEDALAQLRAGRARVEALVGRPVDGLWPSEGAVGPEVVELAAAAGYTWFASDEGVLERSERTPSEGAPGPWQVGPLRGVFRDHALSDRVGFVYQGLPGVEAVADLRARAAGREVLVVLDGENPWESFPDAGRAFLEGLCREPMRPARELAFDPPRGTVHRLHTGSWINADLGVWYGHPEDRAGWRLLVDARAAWEAAGRPDAALRHLHSAEGSDWFWWFGEDFHTPMAGAFDALFRAHVAAVWRACGLEPPAAVTHAIKGRGESRPARGAWEARDDWFAWCRRGREVLAGGAMAAGATRSVEYGPVDGGWRLRLVPPSPGWTADGMPFVDGEVTVVGPLVDLADGRGGRWGVELGRRG